MKALFLIISVVCLFASCSSNETDTEKENAVTEEHVETAFQSIVDSVYMGNPDAKGISVHIECPDRGTSWSYATGLADTVSQTPLTANHPVLIASMTKTYVAATLFTLIKSSKYDINLESKVSEFLGSNSSRMLIGVPNWREMQVKHLLSHTSGINDYAEHPKFIGKVISDPMHRWTRHEQLLIALNDSKAVGFPGEHFFYSDANYLLLTEIIEKVTGKPYYEAMRELLHYEGRILEHTWFATLEPAPVTAPQPAKQYFSSFGNEGMDTYRMDVSFDLYGGGGIVATMIDVARFVQDLFDQNTGIGKARLEFMQQEPKTMDSTPSNYGLGLEKSTAAGLESYGHGGFWGTLVMFVPELNATVSIAVLERDRRDLRQVLLDELVEKLK